MEKLYTLDQVKSWLENQKNLSVKKMLDNLTEDSLDDHLRNEHLAEHIDSYVYDNS